jgi:hypothetical protein
MHPRKLLIALTHNYVYTSAVIVIPMAILACFVAPSSKSEEYLPSDHPLQKVSQWFVLSIIHLRIELVLRSTYRM